MSTSKQEKLFDLDLISLEGLADSGDPLLMSEQNARVKGKKYIIFMLDAVHFAIASNRVSEVIRPLSFTVLPNVPEWLSGIANLRGDILSIIDLQAIWKMKSTDSPKSKLIVLRPDNHDAHLAFKVDKLREIATLPDDQIKPAGKNDLPHLFGKVMHKSNLVNLLDIDGITSSLTLV